MSFPAILAGDFNASPWSLMLRTLLERSGARVSLANKRHPEHGAIIRLDWPRAWLEQGQSDFITGL